MRRCPDGVLRALGLEAESAARSDPAALEWERIVASAARHELSPVLYSCTKRQQLIVSPAAAESFRDAYLTSAARNLRLFKDLGQILGAAGDSGIGMVPLKGACLAETVYDDPALRPMSDLDLLVKPPDLPRACTTAAQPRLRSQPAL